MAPSCGAGCISQGCVPTTGLAGAACATGSACASGACAGNSLCFGSLAYTSAGCVNSTNTGLCSTCAPGLTPRGNAVGCLSTMEPGAFCTVNGHCSSGDCRGQIGRCCAAGMSDACQGCDAAGKCTSCGGGLVLSADGSTCLSTSPGSVCTGQAASFCAISAAQGGGCKAGRCCGVAAGYLCTGCDSSGACISCPTGMVVSDGTCVMATTGNGGNNGGNNGGADPGAAGADGCSPLLAMAIAASGGVVTGAFPRAGMHPTSYPVSSEHLQPGCQVMPPVPCTRRAAG